MSDISLRDGHTTIHNHNAYHDATKEEWQKLPVPDSHAAVERMTAVQVVDRLRWWRIHRVREQPIPVDHFVLRGSYVNYSSFGTRPLAPGVMRLLQKARVVRAQYLRVKQQQQQEALRQSQQVSSLLMASAAGASVHSASSGRLGTDTRVVEPDIGCVSEVEGHRCGERQQRHLREMNDDTQEKVNNKRRATVITSWPRSPRPLNEDDISCLGDPASQRDSATPHIMHTSLSASGSAGTSTAHHRAASGHAQGLGTPSCALCIPSEQEARAAERLLTLFRPRAASAPLRSRRYQYVAGYHDAASSGLGDEPSLQRGRGCTDAAGLHNERMTRVSTSDEIKDVRRAPGAAEAVIVLHHAPRLILYEKGLNPKAALRAARISSDALESLDGAAAESSAEVFELRNLPLCAFERFFYQQQLCGLAEASWSHKPGMRPASVTAPDASVASGEVPEGDTASGATGAAAAAVAASHASVDGGIVSNRNDAFSFGSPSTVSVACSLRTTVPRSSDTGPGSRIREGRDTAAQQTAPHRGRGRDNCSTIRRGGRVALRAVSVPALPPVYRGGCPQMAVATPHRHLRTGARLQQQQQSSTRPSSILPVGLRTSKLPQDGAHLCLRVDDLQDVYVFNPVVDMIGKGAFSKVYAALPIFRGKEGLRRFASPLLDGQAVTCGSDDPSGADPWKGARCVSVARRVSPVRRNSSSALRMDSAAGTSAGDVAGPLTGDEGAKRASHAQPLMASLHSIPVVALKVIPRKARQRPKAVRDPLANMNFTAAAAEGSIASNAQQAVPNDHSSVRRELVEIEREVSILRSLRHSGCSQFFEAIRTPDAFVIAMRVFPGSMDAQRYLSRYGAPSEARAALLLFQLVSTVQYLHSNFGLIHRDIKLENILLSEADVRVPDARIREVLGPALHKSDSSKMVAEEEGGRKDRDSTATSAETRTAAEHRYSTLAHNVARLLRVTLIDFGLARRTRSTTLVPIVAAPRGRGAGTWHGSLNASTTSSTHLASFPPASVSPAAGHPHALHNPCSNSYSGSLCSPASHSAGGAAGAVTPVNGVNSSSNSHTSVKPAPPKPPLLCRPPSAAAGACTTRLGSSNGGINVMERSTSRVGMPSPMPSTANMFTRFLDLEEEMDDEDNGGGGVAGISNMNTSTATKVGGLGRGSGHDMANDEEDSGAFSTDVSASETDYESEGGSTAESKEGSVQNGGGRLATGSQQEHMGRNALMSPGVLRTQPQTPSGPAIIASTSLPPTPLHVAGTTAHTLDHFNAENSSGGCNTNGPTAGLRNRCASCIYTSNQQLPPAPPIVGAGVHSALDDTEATLLLTPCGTEKYLPPEVLSWVLEHGWSRRSTTVGLARAMDLYSIGIVAYVLLSGCFPFNASSRATLLQQQQRVPRCNSARWTGVSSAAISFVQRLLEPNPRKRMTAKEALAHPFLREARQLAEKLLLVPHGEGEEAPHLPSWRDGSHTDNNHRHSRSSTGCHLEDDTNAHAWSHWATNTTAAANVPRSVSLPMHPDNMHSASVTERSSTQPPSSLSLAVYDSQRPHAADPYEPAAANEPSLLSGSSSGAHYSGADGGGGLLLYRVEDGTAAAAGSANSGCHLCDAPHVCHSSGEYKEDDARASTTRDTPGKVQPLLHARTESSYLTRPPVSVTPTLATPCAAAPAGTTAREMPAPSSLAVHPARPPPSSTLPCNAIVAATSDEGGPSKTATLPEPKSPAAVSESPALAPSSKDAEAANWPVSPLPATTPSTAEATEGCGDDLFESLYNNIMSSD
ncbi:protein kinase, putative [Leishmania tarentolae]|uniref:Protein kinase, putative n=1 Tax=Leishmania tarentolae TaxID=5689 RepID=A0A640KKI4_LEITA|nr:protein kinase, putative [Leishmania tarentolae]